MDYESADPAYHNLELHLHSGRRLRAICGRTRMAGIWRFVDDKYVGRYVPKAGARQGMLFDFLQATRHWDRLGAALLTRVPNDLGYRVAPH